MVLPELTPYRTPMLDGAAARDEIELTALYAGGWSSSGKWRRPATSCRDLEGTRVPGAAGCFVTTTRSRSASSGAR